MGWGTACLYPSPSLFPFSSSLSPLPLLSTWYKNSQDQYIYEGKQGTLGLGAVVMGGEGKVGGGGGGGDGEWWW